MTIIRRPKSPQYDQASAQIGEFAVLRVTEVHEKLGAFLDWGLEKDLLLPFSEQTNPVRRGQKVLAFVQMDKENRPFATMKIDKHFVPATGEVLKVDQAVSLIIGNRSELGYRVVVNKKYQGLLYANETFRELLFGEQSQGYITKIREDGKLDIKLLASGHKAAVDEIGPLILEKLHQNKGFLPITDKTEAPVIYDLWGVSKKKFKIALGGLYKNRLIEIKDDGIYLLQK